MNWKVFILGGIFATVGLLVSVPLFDFATSLLSVEGPAAAGYHMDEIRMGILAESIRGFAMSGIYFYLKGAGRSYGHAIVFGLAASVLIGSLWVVLGHHYCGFGIGKESLLLGLQGIVSGTALGLVFREWYKRKAQ